IRNVTIPAHRGMITDRNGKPLAVSTPVVSVWMNPQHFTGSVREVANLAQALGMSNAKLQEKLKRYRKKQFVYLKRHMSPEKAEKVFGLGLRGVYSKKEYQRFYPAGEVAAHLVGYVNIDSFGQEGFEYSYDDWLQGEAGSKQVVKDLYQRTIKNVKQIKAPKMGQDLALSIDLRLQFIAYKALKEAVSYHRADAGSIVVLDVLTGEVLAMANQPAFNPNNRKRININAVRNRAVTDVFEPGSTMKPITMMAALESGKYKLHSKIDTRPGYVKVGRKTFLDPVNYGVIDLKKVLAKSSQVGTVKIAVSLKQEQLYDAFYRMGIGQYLGTGFPGESTGYLPNKANWKPVEQAAMGFGAGVSVTALQLAHTYSIFANKGVKKPVSLMRVDDASDIQSESVVKLAIAEDVGEMLAAVTSKIGTAKKANTQYFKVAGKTGTSHKVGKGGYQSGSYMSFFAGYAPQNNPRIAVVVVVDDPKGREYYGGEVAAPVFSQVVSNSLRVLGVMPDKVPRAVFRGASL
ncbi:MAG: penicillin-binding protein 2, partial [Sinobacterium sp.]|nr:penicillin-binding protein 2 [Sinobacterium sp.]